MNNPIDLLRETLSLSLALIVGGLVSWRLADAWLLYRDSY